MVLLSVVAVFCIVAFVVCAFALRARMSRLHVLYETQTKTLQAAELVLLQSGGGPDVERIEREIHAAVQNAHVMRKNAALFRLLWPAEYESAFFAGERLIAQASRVVALSGR